MKAQSTFVAVLAASLNSNALGRALSLAALVKSGDVEVWGPKTNKLWVGAQSSHIPIHPFSPRQAANRIDRELASGRDVVLWTSKGYPFAAALVKRFADSALVIADFDDDDVALASEFVQSNRLNRVKLNPLRAGSPERVARSQRLVIDHASGFTVSSHALAESLTLPPDWVRVPHARHLARTPPATNSHPHRLGFLGTIRPHKGVDEIIEAMRSDSRLEIVSFAQAGFAPPPDLSSRWTALPPNTSLDTAYALVDVAVLPMDPQSEAARHQLPAKAIDAATHGVPIAANPTPVLVEYFGDTLIRINDWGLLGDTLAGLASSGALQRMSDEVYRIAGRDLTIDVVSAHSSRYIEERLNRRQADA